MNTTLTYTEAVKAAAVVMDSTSVDAFTLSFILACQFQGQKEQILEDIIAWRMAGLEPEVEVYDRLREELEKDRRNFNYFLCGEEKPGAEGTD